MHNVDPRIVALVFAQLVFDLGGVSDEIELFDLLVIAQRHNGAGNEVGRPKVTAHRVEGDLHQGENLRTLLAECKAKMRGVEGLKGDKRFCHFERSEESLIISSGRAGTMIRDVSLRST